MRFVAAFTALLGLAGSTVAQSQQATPGYNSIVEPKSGSSVAVGSTLSIKWAVGTVKPTGKVKIELLGGKDDNSLVPKLTIATGVDNSALKYDWLVDAKSGKDAVYGVRISAEDDPTTLQWSQPFKITGGAAESSSSGSGSSSTTSPPSSTTASTTGASTTSASTSAASTPQPSGNGTNPSPNPSSSSPSPSATTRPGAGVAGATVNVAGLLLAVVVSAMFL